MHTVIEPPAYLAASKDAGMTDSERAAIVDLIAATTTKTGLTVRCELDNTLYPKGVALAREHMDTLNITRNAFHGDWNYTIHPAETITEPVEVIIFG